MNTLSGFLDEAYMSWLRSSVNCCPSLKEKAPRSRGEFERPMRIEHHQPRLIPPPIPEPQTRGRDFVSRSKSFASRASSRGSFSARRKLNAYNGPRRPRIGAPSDFQHLNNAAPAMPRRTDAAGFRPLELSIYEPQNQLSPLLPRFRPEDVAFSIDDELKDLPRPPTAMTHSSGRNSTLSFRIARKPVRNSSRASSEWTAQFQPRPESLTAQELLARLETELPQPPPPARLRAMTEPPTYERIKSALHEKFELEQRLKDIDEVIEERRSIYLSSRPTSRATSRARSIYASSQAPIPSPPPLQPSFASRVLTPTPQLQRPQTAPQKPTLPIPSSSATPPSPPPKSSLRHLTPPPPPPLPLILHPHPPLRKKKSFSRISHWLSGSPSHSRGVSGDSVTNTPRLLREREGFYQCVDVRGIGEGGMGMGRRESFSTVVSTLVSEEDEEGVVVGWTPESSPGRERDFESGEMQSDIGELERTRTLGRENKEMMEEWRLRIPEKGYVPGRNSVGVAF